MNNDQTVHGLLLITYPRAAASVSSLRELVKTNPELLEQVIELSIMIGINAAMQRLETDKRLEKIEGLKLLSNNIGDYPRW